MRMLRCFGFVLSGWSSDAPGVDAPQVPDHDLLPDPRHHQVAVARLGLPPHRQSVSGTETRALERVSAHAQEVVRP